jgi:inward rectifier potassium channel
MELEAKVMLMTVDQTQGKGKRDFAMLRLERPQVLFMPLSWTVVHPIDENSPLWGKTADDLARLQAEVLILVKGYDDTFSQTVLARHSYRHDEFLWNKRFAPAFFVDDEGDLVLELKKVGEVAGETQIAGRQSA